MRDELRTCIVCLKKVQHVWKSYEQGLDCFSLNISHEARTSLHKFFDFCHAGIEVVKNNKLFYVTLMHGIGFHHVCTIGIYQQWKKRKSHFHNFHIKYLLTYKIELSCWHGWLTFPHFKNNQMCTIVSNIRHHVWIQFT